MTREPRERKHAQVSAKTRRKSKRPQAGMEGPSQPGSETGETNQRIARMGCRPGLEAAVGHRFVAAIAHDAAEHGQTGVFADHPRRTIAQRNADGTGMESVPVEPADVDAVEEADGRAGVVD